MPNKKRFLSASADDPNDPFLNIPDDIHPWLVDALRSIKINNDPFVGRVHQLETRVSQIENKSDQFESDIEILRDRLRESQECNRTLVGRLMTCSKINVTKISFCL